MARASSQVARIPPERLPGEVFSARLSSRSPLVRTRTRWTDYEFWLAWERTKRA